MVETSDVEDIRARFGLFTLVLKNGIFFVMPRLYLEAVAAAKKALAKDRHRVNLEWEFDDIGFRKTFGIDPKDIDVWKIAKKPNISKKFDFICDRVTSSPFCRRASFSSDFARLSKETLNHKTRESSVIFE